MSLDAFEPEYLVALDEIYHSHWAARKKRRIALLREAVAHFWPQGHPSRLIHITGTNGKGSTAFHLENGLAFAGPSGSWTGPHVFDYAERFHIGGQSPDHGQIVAIYREEIEPYQRALGERRAGLSLSFAEVGILIALHLFQRHGVVWGIMEVGAGGRYTPLMALDMAACVLTNIGADHPRTLGEHPWQRALEKAGIARCGVPFFTGDEGPTLDLVRKAAEVAGAPVFAVAQTDLDAVRSGLERDQPAFRIRNLALACKTIRHFYPHAELALLLAAMKASLPARFALVAPNIVADVAHNADKVARLAEALRLAWPGRKFVFLVGLTRSRGARDTFAAILPLAERIVITGASYAGRDPQELAAELQPVFTALEVIAQPRAAFERVSATLADGQMLVLTGSAYMIDQALNPNPFLRDTNACYGRRKNSDG